ncbi:GNAT family N-acetyltransferase [Jidongwangia harbinensis]|uniref:GNAT family N-acetyltransferase n=1 Tax=Jidongwangia harbinensis TaxID=2878561 RepID=UPI001CD9B829|nr:GNAT family protein [Jidongwangia harbinensis]MCA2215560.1 GNAT family N-acetyltransferase [Jidongwangia harbinensis]
MTAVRLRDLRPDDHDALAAGLGDRFVRTEVPQIRAGGGDVLVIAEPESDRLLGSVALDRVVPARGQAEIGCWVRPADRGRGVGTAALRALAGRAFAAGLARLELITHGEDPFGQRAAMAAGFQREGVRRGAAPNPDGGRDDLLVFTRLATDPPGPVARALPDLPGGELTDGVITLRPLTVADLDFYAALHREADVVATTVPPVPPSPAEMRRRCGWAAANWLAGQRADLVITDAATGTPAGEIGLFYQEPPTAQAMIGYSMLPAWRGRGFPTRAAQLVALWAFAETSIARLIAGALPTNLGSQRVLEKAGFRREAYLRSRLPGPDGTRYDDVQFVLLPEDVVDRLGL